MTTRSDIPTYAASATRCASCGKRLTGRYYTLVDRAERYCAECIATRPRCNTCGAPLDTNSWQLHDGRVQCARCHGTAVYELGLACTIYDETITQVAAHLGLVLNVGVKFRMVDAPTLRAVRQQDSDYSPSASENTLGLYQRQRHKRVIYLLYGLPRLLFRTTVAHEYAHAWQGENCPLLESKLLLEGFAEWVAYRHLAALGCSRATARMLGSMHPYRPALEHVLELERQFGTAGLIDYIRRAE